MNYGMGDVSDWLSAWFGLQRAVPSIVAPSASSSATTTPSIPPLQEDVTVTPSTSGHQILYNAQGQPIDVTAQGQQVVFDASGNPIGTQPVSGTGIPVWVWAVAGVFVFIGLMGMSGGRRR
jgi:hypothetical protein